MRVPSTPIILTAAALSLAGNVASSTTSSNANTTASTNNSTGTAPSSTVGASSSMATMSSSSSLNSSQTESASTAGPATSSNAASSTSASPAAASGKPARREAQIPSRLQSRFARERYAARSPSPKSDAVHAAADQSGNASTEPQHSEQYEDWEEAAGRKERRQENGRRDVMEAWEAASRHGSSNRWKREGSVPQAKGLIKIRSKGFASSLEGHSSTTAPLQEADKSKDKPKPKPKPATKPKEVPTDIADEEAMEEDMDVAGEDGDDEADVKSILEDRRRSSNASARRGSVNRLNLNGRRSKPSSRRGSFEDIGSGDDSNSDSNPSPSAAISSSHRRHNIKRLLDLQLGGAKSNGHTHASVADDDDEDCEADDESVDQSSQISISARDEGDEQGDVTEEAEDKAPVEPISSSPKSGGAELSPTLADLKWQDEQLQIAIKAIENLDSVGTTTGRKANSGNHHKQKRDDDWQSASQDLNPITDPASAIVSPFESALPAQVPNPFSTIPQDSYTSEQQAAINSLLKGLKGYGGDQSGWVAPGGQFPSVASAVSPLAGPIDSLPSGSGARAQAQAQLQQALSVLGYANNPNALAGYLSQMGMVGQGQSPDQLAQGLLGQVQNLGNSQPFSSVQSQLGLGGVTSQGLGGLTSQGLGGLTSQQQGLLNSLGLSREAQSKLASMGIGNLASQQSATGLLPQTSSSSALMDQQRQQLLNILQSQGAGGLDGMKALGQMTSWGTSGGSPMSSMMNSMGMSGGSNPATSSPLNGLAGSSLTPTAQQLQNLSPSQLASLSYAANGPLRFMAGPSNSSMPNSTMSSNATASNDTMAMSLSTNTTMPSNSTMMPSNSTMNPTNSTMSAAEGNGTTTKRSFGQLGQLPSSLSPEQLSQLQGLLQSSPAQLSQLQGLLQSGMGSIPNLGQFNPALGGVQQSLSPAQAQAVVGALTSLAGNANGLSGGGQLSLSQLKGLESQLQNGPLAGTPAGGLISSLFGNLPLKLKAEGQTTPDFPASEESKSESASESMDEYKPTPSKSLENAKETSDANSSTWSYSEWTTVMPSSKSSTDNRWPSPTNVSSSTSGSASATPTSSPEAVGLGKDDKYAWSWSSSEAQSSTSISSSSAGPSQVALGNGNRYAWSWNSEDAENKSNLFSRWFNNHRKRSEASKESDLISASTQDDEKTVAVTETVTPTSTPSMTKSKMHHSKTKSGNSSSSTGSPKDKDGEEVEDEVKEEEFSSSKKHHTKKLAASPSPSPSASNSISSSSSSSSASSMQFPAPTASASKPSSEESRPTLASGQMTMPSGMMPYPDA